MGPRRALITLVWLILPWDSPASAQPEAPAALPLDLAWTAPDGCPGERDVKAQIARLARSSRPGVPRLQASARVERSEDGAWRVTLQTFAPDKVTDDSRELVGDSCDAVAGSVAVVLALRLDSANEGPSPETPPAAPLPPPPPTPYPARPSVRTTGPRRFALGAGGAGDTSALPRATLGGAVHAAVRLGVTHLSLQGIYWVPRELDLGAGRAGTFHFWTVAVAACPELVPLGSGSVFGPCLALEAGALSAESSGVRIPGRTTEPWIAARAGGRLSIALGPGAALWLTADLAVPFRRPSFVVEGLEMVHRPAPLSARASLGAEWWF